MTTTSSFTVTRETCRSKVHCPREIGRRDEYVHMLNRVVVAAPRCVNGPCGAAIDRKKVEPRQRIVCSMIHRQIRGSGRPFQALTQVIILTTGVRRIILSSSRCSVAIVTEFWCRDGPCGGACSVNPLPNWRRSIRKWRFQNMLGCHLFAPPVEREVLKDEPAQNYLFELYLHLLAVA